MNKPNLLSSIPGLLALVVPAVVLFAVPALATEPAGEEVPETVATTDADKSATTTTTATTVTSSTDEAPEKVEEKSPWSASITAETSIGLGTFVGGDENNPLVTTTFAPKAGYKLSDFVNLGAAFSVTWYNNPDFGTPLKDNEVLMSDVAFSVSHSQIYKHEDTGFKISGSLGIGLPTSLASQFQNRLFTLSTGLGLSIPVGPVTFSYSFGFAKYFNDSATPSVDCDAFDDPTFCAEGRAENEQFGLESQRRGAELFIPSAGVASYSFTNGLTVGWSIIDDLSLSAALRISNVFGVRSIDEDEFTNINADGGRAQTDRLITSIGLSYSVMKHLSVGTSLVTATARPFGADGADLVLFGFSRASDNITSLNFSVTGSL